MKPTTLRALAIAALTLLSFPLLAYHPQWVTRDTNFRRAFWPRGFHVADFTGDGRADVVMRHQAHMLYLAKSNADGTLSAAASFYTADFLSDSMAAEVTGDAHTDVIAADTATHTIRVLRANGDGTFAAPIVTALTFSPSQLAKGDFNGDGKLDLAVRSYNTAQLVVLAGDDAGHFTEISRRSISRDAQNIAGGDIDGDGKDDVLIADYMLFQFSLYFGRGNGTFDEPVVVTTPVVPASHLELADLDGDGDTEILTAEFSANTITVYRNSGARTFASADTYHFPRAESGSGSPTGLAVADFSDDGIMDVAVALSNLREVATLAGKGDGTLGTPVRTPMPRWDYYNEVLPNDVGAADFNGDGRVDLAVASPSFLGTIFNVAGDAELALQTLRPTTSTGQTVTFIATLYAPPDAPQQYASDRPFPTGTVTFRSGDTVIGTVTPQNREARLELTTLPAATHSITAHFAGDDDYRPVSSNTVTQKVVSYQTTVTLTQNGMAAVYGDSWTLQSLVSSPAGGSVDGQIRLYANGAHPSGAWSSPITNGVSWNMSNLEPGTYDLHAEYEGNETQPPGKSSVLRVVVAKGATRTRFSNFGEVVARLGETKQLSVSVEGENNPHGTVRVYNGTALLATLEPFANFKSFTMPALPAGVHYLRAVFDGGPNWQRSESSLFRYTVIPQGFVVVATAGEQSISVVGYYSAQPAASFFNTYERVGNGAWTLVTYSSSYSRNSPQAGTIYSYRMEAFDSAGTLIGTSNIDTAMKSPAYTDLELRSGMSIKAAHLQELVSATNLFRAHAGLAAITLPDATPGKTIRKAHIDQLRNAIDEVRVMLGAAAMPVLHIAPNTVVRATHIQQLRDALR